MPVVDFTDVKELSFDPIPRGRYLASVETAEVRQSQNSEFEYLALVWEVLPSDEAVKGDYVGRKLFDNMSFSPNALWRLKSFLKQAAEYSDEELSREFEVDPSEFIGLESELQVTVGSDNQGGQRNNITRYYAA